MLMCQPSIHLDVVGAVRSDSQQCFRGWCEPICFFLIETSPYDVFLLWRPKLYFECAAELRAWYANTLEPFAVGLVVKDCIAWDCDA